MLHNGNFDSFQRTIVVSFFVFISSAYADTNNESSIIQLLVTQVESMQERIVKLEKSEASLKQSVGALIGTTAQFRLQIAYMTKTLEAYEKSDEKKEERIKNLENELAKKSEKCSVLEEHEHERKHDAADEGQDPVETTKNLIKKGIRQTREHVAFSAYLDHVIRSLGDDQAIVYNVVLLNEAGAYSKTTGQFRAPVSGVYLFSWSVSARQIQQETTYDIWSKLVVNGVHKVSTAAETQSFHDDNQGSSTVLVRLSQGDDVWTAAQHAGDRSDIFGSDFERTTSFSGVLMYMD